MWKKTGSCALTERAPARDQVSGLDDTGAVFEYAGTSMNVTEREHAEEALHQWQMEPAHANHAATMGQLTAAVAHELSLTLAKNSMG